MVYTLETPADAGLTQASVGMTRWAKLGLGGGLIAALSVLVFSIYLGIFQQPIDGSSKSSATNAISKTVDSARPETADAPRGDAAASRTSAAATGLETDSATGSIGPALPTVSPYTWAAERQGQEVRLTGHVPSDAVRAEMVAIARREIGDLPVIDRTQVAAGRAPGLDFVAATGAALAGLAQLQEGRVELTDSRLAIRGKAKDKAALAAIDVALRNLPRGLQPGSVSVTTPTAAPYAFSVQRTPGAVILSGYLPDAAARAEIAKHIRSRFFQEEIVDTTRLADGAPPHFAAAAALAVDHLSQLAVGQASVAEGMVRVAGEALYAQAAGRMRDTIAKEAPNGWRGVADIKVRGASTARAEISP
jgi:OmpA-OmpF porin, OOP family